MTGMPSWGASHKDNEIWDIVAFLKILPEISAADYNELNRTVTAGHSHEGSDTSTGHSDTLNHSTVLSTPMPADTGEHHGDSAHNH